MLERTADVTSPEMAINGVVNKKLTPSWHREPQVHRDKYFFFLQFSYGSESMPRQRNQH